MTSHRLRAVAALSLLVLVAGCGGKDDDGGGGGDSDFAKQSGNEIADSAKADMEDLEQVKYSGEISTSGSKINLDISASAAGDCTGTIGIGDGTAEVLAKDGKNWFKPDEAFWRASAPDQADQIIAAVGDKWVLDTDANFAQFCDLDAFFDSIFADDEGNTADYEVKGTDEIDGDKVVAVERTGKDGPATGYVLTDGKHYLVKLERTDGDDTGALEFTDFNKEFDVEAPADDEVVDLSQLS
jgi:hypothetical protein